MSLGQVTRIIFPLIGDRLSTGEGHGKAHGRPYTFSLVPGAGRYNRRGHIADDNGYALSGSVQSIMCLEYHGVRAGLAYCGRPGKNAGSRVKRCASGYRRRRKRFIIVIRVRGQYRELNSGKLLYRGVVSAGK